MLQNIVRSLSLKKLNVFFDYFIYLYILMIFIHPLSLVSVSHPLLLLLPSSFHQVTLLLLCLQKINPLSLIKLACMSTGVREAVYRGVHTHYQLRS